MGGWGKEGTMSGKSVVFLCLVGYGGNEEERSFKFTERVTEHNFIVVSTEEERTDIDNI